MQAELRARADAEASGATYVSPYNDPAVVAGQGTVGLELLLALRGGQLGAVLVPVGGGGLVGGIAAMLKAVDPSVRVCGAGRTAVPPCCDAILGTTATT